MNKYNDKRQQPLLLLKIVKRSSISGNVCRVLNPDFWYLDLHSLMPVERNKNSPNKLLWENKHHKPSKIVRPVCVKPMK